MNRLILNEECPHCIGRQVAEQVANQEARHPLAIVLGFRIVLTPPMELGPEFNNCFQFGFAERMAEIARIRIMCN